MFDFLSKVFRSSKSPIDLPRIQGSTHDRAINELIAFSNQHGDIKYSAHVVSAIIMFLDENHELEACMEWCSKVMPQVGDIKCHDPVIDTIHGGLVKLAKKYDGDD